MTIAYVPLMTMEKGSAGAERSRIRRMEILQRVLYLALRSTISASHNGVQVSPGARGPLLALPRIILYICDQPEERQVLCFKPRMCRRPCTLWDVLVSDLSTAAALDAKERCPVSVVERQLEAYELCKDGRDKRRRLHIEKEWSISSQPPALGAMAGLCTPPFLLCKIAAIDVLHVRVPVLTPGVLWAVSVCPGAINESPFVSLHEVTGLWTMCRLRTFVFHCCEPVFLRHVLDLEITRDLVRHLVSIFPCMCAEYEPVCGSFSATYAEAYMRLLDLGRRSKASSVRPG